MANPKNPLYGPQFTTVTNDSLIEDFDYEKKKIDELARYRAKLEAMGFKKQDKNYKELMSLEEKNLKKKFELQKKNDKVILNLRVKEEEKARKKQELELQRNIVEEYKLRDNLTKEELKTYKEEKKKLAKAEREQAFKDAQEQNKQFLKGLPQQAWNNAFKNASAAMNEVMSSYAKYQSAINVRLQGTSSTFQNLQRNLLNNVGITPYIRTQNMLNNLQALVESGVAFNLEQRAFLMSISDKIAATFDANTGTLRRIIRLQQEDSTAGRLGMEAYMTRFMNNMFENTEYLVDSFDTVTDALVEATSQMSTQMGVEFEYVVQKWLGSLSSVGLSSTTVSSIAQAIGYLASGDIAGLSGSNMQNLLVMAASRAGLDYGSMLQGTTTKQVNTLLGSLVSYMQEIGTNTSNVVKNQFAKTFGLSMSDIRAAGNLKAEDLQNISKNLLSYSGAVTELGSQMSQVYTRMSLAEMLENVSENAKYALFSTIAANPALYGLWKVTDMIQGLTGGINIPFASVLGTGVDINATVDQLMKLGVIGAGSLGMIGDIVSGISNTVDFANVMGRLGIGSNIIGTTRGRGIGSLAGGLSESTSTYIGQSSGSAFYEQTMRRQAQENDAQIQQMKEQQVQPIENIDTNVATIVRLLESGISVTVNNYGLTTSNIG